MSLSIKRLDKNPWKIVGEQFNVGQKIKGKITNITDFGVFVELLPGIDGLVHIVQHPSDRYAVGQDIDAIILSIDVDNKKVSLGIKQLTEDPWSMVEQEYVIGTIVEGKVSKIANFGAFIKLPTGIEGLIHNTTLLQEEGKKAEQFFKVGDSCKFRVISLNKEEHKLGLSTNIECKSIAAVQEIRKEEHVVREDKPRAQKREQREQRSTKYEDTGANTQQPSKIKTSFQIALESAMAERKDDNNSEGK
jgi:small subunit ribosomal protein S1